MIPPRKTPNRDAKYIGLAVMAMAFSKDPSTQVGCYIVDENNEPRGWGYNGPAAVIDDHSFSWERPGKNEYIDHAEENAINYSIGRRLTGCTLYVTALPCKNCMKAILRNRIKRVVYLERPVVAGSLVNADREIILDLANKGGVELVEFQGTIEWLPNWINDLKEKGIFDKYFHDNQLQH